MLHLHYMQLQGNPRLFGPCYALLGWDIQVVEEQEQATTQSEGYGYASYTADLAIPPARASHL